MRLVLFRHAVAFPREDPDCPPDAERPLTDPGRRRCERAARGLRALGVRPDHVLSSPLRRARETAEIAARVLEFPAGRIVVTAALAPDADPALLLSEIAPLGGDVLCAGHAPHLEYLAARALALRGGPPFALGKAGALALELDPEGGPARLDWLLTPRALRTLGG